MKPKFLRDEAYCQIRQRMALGQLAAGTELSEPQLAEILGISRTPVREALQQLEVEGFVERSPKCRTVVRTPTRRDVVELFELREGLESYAVMLATERHTPDDISKLRALCQEMKIIEDSFRTSGKKTLSKKLMKRFVAADMGFHILLLRAARNRPLMKIVSDSHVMSRVFGTSRDSHSLELIQDANQEHDLILKAVEKYDVVEARKQTILHVKQGLIEVLGYVEDEQSDETQTNEPEYNDLPLPSDVIAEFKRVGLKLAGETLPQEVERRR